MKPISIRFKLLFSIIGTLIVATIGILIVADRQFTQILDKSQNATYTEKVDTIWRTLKGYEDQLQMTGLVEVYGEDFRASAVKSLRQTYYKGQNQRIYPFILSMDSKAVMHPEWVVGELSLECKEIARKMLSSEEGDFEYVSLGERRWSTFKQFSEWNWVIGYSVPLDIKYADVQKFNHNLVLIMAAITFLASLLMWLIISRVTKPIIKLTQSANSIADGNYSSIPDVSGTDEVGQLAQGFKSMAEAVGETILDLNKEIDERKRAEEALQDSERRMSIKNRVAHIFLTVPDEEMYGEVLHAILEATGSRYGIFGYIDEKGTWICPSLTRDIWDQCWVADKDIAFPREQWGGIWGKAMAEKKSFFSNESLNVPEGHIPILRALDVPIIHNEELIGNFFVGNKETDYDEKNKEFLEILIEYIAPVLHARLQRDIKEEEKKKLETQLQQSQKMESIGTLAGGVAHEINNPIYGIMNYAQLISERLDPESPLREFSDGIGHETKRVATVVRNLLTFASQEKESHSPARIVDIMNNTISLIRTIIRRDQITLDVDVPDNLPKIKCRSKQIQQVMMNLLTNARDALNERYPEHDPDKIIVVTVRSFERDGQPWIRTTVEDHGAGIPNEIRERLFDPFYTTKDRTKGTGLGLSISHGIVQDHYGELSFECERDQYTRFHLDLPVDNGWEI